MYYPFTKPLSEISYFDINNFFESSTPEGLFVEYKSAIPAKLSKNIAAFANTSGGLIFIGVEEDESTKAPKKWEGIENADNLSERINQFIGNVRPLPECDHVTIDIPDSNRKIIVILVSEGYDTPYFRTNDLSVWVRTGDVSTQIDQADRSTLRYLYEKNSTAINDQESRLDDSKAVYLGRMRKAPRINQDVTANDIHEMIITPQVSMTIQPYGNKILCTSAELKNNITEYRITGSHTFGDIPALHSEASLSGIASSINDSFVSARYRPLHYYITNYGLVNIRRKLKHEHQGIEYIYLPHLTTCLKDLLGVSSKLYKKFSYVGSLQIHISLENIDGYELSSSFDIGDFDTSGFADNSNFSWQFSTTTIEITNDEDRLRLMGNIIKQIFWDLGYENVSHSAQPS